MRDTARIATFTITTVKDADTGEVREKPVVLVRQDGSDTTFMANLNPEIHFKDTYIGMPVKVHWKEEATGSLTDIEYYDLAEDDAKDLGLRKD